MRWLVVSVVVFGAVFALRMGTIGTSGQASFGLRSPATSSNIKLDLTASLDNLKKQFSKFSLSSCANVLNEANAEILELNPSRLQLEQLKNSTPQILQMLFETKLALLAHSKTFAVAELSKNVACVSGLRASLLAIRTLEDVLGERLVGFPDEDSDDQPGVLSGKAPYFMVNPTQKPFVLKSGDVLLSRGTAFVGTAMARLGGDHSVFSLIEIVYKDSATGKQWTIGAHVGVGATARTIESYLEVEKVRTLVYRFHDPQIAASAAKMIFGRVTEYESEHGESIPYDFKLDANDSSAFSSSELVARAFADASRAEVKIPAYLSQIKMENKDLIGRMGLHNGPVFMPGDIELDPRFELVAEWRDLGRVSKSHMRDAALTAVFNWMERENYSFKQTYPANMQNAVAWSLRSWPIFSSLVENKMPSRMNEDLLGVMTSFNEVTESLFDRLDEVNDEHRKETGFWLTKKEMLLVLEAYRRDDLKKYEIYQKTHSYDPLAEKPDFHLIFRR